MRSAGFFAFLSSLQHHSPPCTWKQAFHVSFPILSYQWHLPPNEGNAISNIKVALLSCCIRVPPPLPAYTPLISDCLQRYQVKDNYLCIKESAACRLLGSWSFLSSSAPPNHLHLFSLCLLLLVFFFFCCLSLLSSCGLGYPIRLRNKPAKGRLTAPISEDRTASPFYMHYSK